MKSNHLFSAIILIGFGIYFLLSQLQVDIAQNLLSWPTLICIIGLSFLFSFFKTKNNELLLPGIILFGLGVHFHAVFNYGLWSNDLGVYLLIVASGLLLHSLKSRQGLFTSLVVFLMALFLLFNESLLSWLADFGISINISFSLWPFLLIIVGIIFLFMKK